MILINSSPKNALRIFQPFLPIFAPIGAAYLLAVAEREGTPARLVDEQIEPDVFELISRHTKELQPPYLFGFSVLTAANKQALTVSRKLKELYRDSVICFGGPHPTAVPEEVLAHEHIDVVVRGEGESVILDLYRRVKERKDFCDLAGISYRRNGKIEHSPLAPLILDLDSLPRFPYHHFVDKPYDLGFTTSSRGCPYNCIFCSNRNTTGRRYRYKSTELILEDLEILRDKYDQQHVLFLDDNFLVNKDRIYRLLKEMRRRNLGNGMTFSFQARGDNVDFELLKELYATNFRSVFFGLETASEELMRILDKGETVEQCKKAVRMAKEIGFHVSATFMFALPGETHKDRMNALYLSKDLQLDMVRFNNVTPYPGTRLFDIAKQQDRLYIQGEYENFISVSTFIENPFHKIPFSYVPEGNTEQEIRYDLLFSYFAFYLDFRRIRRIFATPHENVGWFNAGENLVKFLRKLPSLISLALIISIKFFDLFLAILWRKGVKLSIRKVIAILSGH